MSKMTCFWWPSRTGRGTGTWTGPGVGTGRGTGTGPGVGTEKGTRSRTGTGSVQFFIDIVKGKNFTVVMQIVDLILRLLSGEKK